MTTRKTSLLLGTTSALALSVFAFSGMGPTPAYACTIEAPNNGGIIDGVTGGYLGNDQPNNIECKDTNTNGAFISTFGDDDTLVSKGGDLATVDMGDDNDTVLLINRFGTNTTANLVDGGDGDDTITTDRAIVGEIRGGNGDDTISIEDRRDDIGLIDGGNGDDVITVDGFALLGGIIPDPAVVDDIDGGSDDDTINLVAGLVTGLVDGGANNDTINLIGPFMAVNNITGSSGEDVINVSGGVAADVLGGGDNDTMTMTGGGVLNLNGEGGDDTIDLQGGAAAFVGGGSGSDLIKLNGADLTGIIISGQSEDDEIQLISGTAGVIEGGTGADIIDQDGASVVAIVGDVFLDGVDTPNGSDDVINLNGGDVTSFKGVGGDVWGQGGDDTITLNGTIVEFNIRGGQGDDDIDVKAGSAFIVQGDAGEDLITMSGGSVFAITGDTFSDDPDGPGGNDTFDLSGGTVGLDIWGQGGEDTITLNGTLVTNDIQGGLDDDVIDLLAGTVTNVWGDAFNGKSQAGSGNDFIRLGTAPGVGSAEVLVDIIGGAGDDTVSMFSGKVGNDVLGGSGQDSIGLFGAIVLGDLNGESGDDLIALRRGSAGAVSGGSNDDVIFIDALGGPVQVASIDGDSGDDTIDLFTGTITGDALGGSGDDVGGVWFDFDFDDLGGGTGIFFGDDGAGDDGDDILDFIDWTGEVNADRLQEWNTVNLTLFTEATFTGGTLETDGPSDIEVFIDDTSALLLNNDGGGDLIIDGNLTNEGLIDLSGADTGTDNVLTVTGDYTAASDLVLDTFLNDGTPDITDQLIIGGNAGGETDLTIVPDAGSPGGLTGFGPEDGILVVAAETSDPGAFSLTNADLVAGIFEYELVNPAGQPAGQSNWYLQSDWLDQIYVYENLPGAMQTIGSALTGQLVERVGVRSAVPSTLADADGNPVRGGAPVDTAIWGRAVGLSLESDGDLDSTTQGSFEQTIGFLQAGVDVTVLERPSGRLLIGALGHWGTSTLDADNSRGAEVGTADFDFYGGGLTATWYSTGGWYFDNVVQYTAYDIDITTATRFSSTSTDGYGIGTSHEVGYRIPIGATAALVPQGQLTYQHLDFDDFTDPDGVRVSYEDDDSLVGRLGVAFENSAAIGSSLATGYVEANVLYEFLGDNSVNTFTPAGGNIALNQQTREAWVEVGFGGTIAVVEGVSLYGEIDYALPLDGGVRGVQALGGIRVNLNPAPPPPPPAPVIAPVAETAFIVFFDWDRADLTSEANLVLDDVVVVANQSGYASIRLDGYTDLSGSAQYNLGLSERRANSVADGLIARGIAPDEIVIRAFGEENPLVPTPDGVREPQNRRVEIFLS